MQKRAALLSDTFNSMVNTKCTKIEGAMYAFPRVELPPKAMDEATRQDVTPDTLYALSLLENTGICVVPASGFGQKEGRIGFRTTFLPPEDELKRAIVEFQRHHDLFCQKYA